MTLAIDLPTFFFGIDLNKDGDYTDTAEDLTPYVVRASWELGTPEQYKTMGRAATLSLTLYNGDKRFSPEYASSPLYPNFTRGRVVKTCITYSATEYCMFIGWLEPIQVDPDIDPLKFVNITANGYLIRVQEAEAVIPIMQGVTADEALEVIFGESLIYPPGFSGRWLAGIIGFSEAGINTIVGGISDYLIAETGITTFEYIGDQWLGKTSIYTAVADVVGREYGRFHANRDGVLMFWNRQHFMLKTAVDATVDNTMSGIDYQFGDIFWNIVTVKYSTRKVGASPEVLGVNNGTVLVPAGSTETDTFNFRDQDSGVNIAGQNLIAPVGNTDFTANSESDGSGTDLTAFISASIITEAAKKGEVQYTNSGTIDAYIEEESELRGTKITDYGVQEITIQDDDSIGEFGRDPYVYAHMMDNRQDAENLAFYLLEIGKQPRGNPKAVVINARASVANMSLALDREIGDRLNIIEDHIETDLDAFIIGEKFDVNFEDSSMIATKYLEPADASKYWIAGVVDFSEAGDTTYAAPF